MSIYFIDTDGDGDYLSLKDAMDDVNVNIEPDLSLSGGHSFNCSGVALDTSRPTINGFINPSADNLININGDGNYHLQSTGDINLVVATAYTELDSLIASILNPTNYDYCVYVTADNVTVKKSIVKQVGVASGTEGIIGIYFQSGVTGGKLFNSLIYKWAGRGVNFTTNNGNQLAYNNTIIGCSGNGLNSSYRGCIAINNASLGNSNDYSPSMASPGSGPFSAGSSNNASSDGTGSTGLLNLVAIDQFTDYANDDFSLKIGSDLIDAGVDLSGIFTTDLLGNARILPFSIGAHGAPATGGPPDSPITVGYISSQSAIFTPTLSAGDAPGISPDLIESSDLIFTPTFSAGDAPNISPDLIASSDLIFSPILPAGDAPNISPDLIASSDLIFSPILPAGDASDISPDLIASSDLIFSPTLSAGDAPFIQLALISSSANVFVPSFQITMSDTGSLKDEISIYSVYNAQIEMNCILSGEISVYSALNIK